MIKKIRNWAAAVSVFLFVLLLPLALAQITPNVWKKFIGEPVPASIYQSRSCAAYWDGRNNVGELVASGIYFYSLTAGEFTSTRKMVIRK